MSQTANCDHTPSGIECHHCDDVGPTKLVAPNDWVRGSVELKSGFTLKGNRKLIVALACSASTVGLALAGVVIAAPYVALGTFCTAMCGANLFEHRAKGGES